MVNIKNAYTIASGQFTLSLATGPLASSATLVAGRASAILDLTANGLPLFLQIGGTTKLGTGPSAGALHLWVYAPYNDTPTYPSPLDGTDKNVTFTNADLRNAAMLQLHAIPTPATTGQQIDFGPKDVMTAINLAGGAGWACLPSKIGIWVVHSTGVALDGTAGNHAFYWKGIFQTAA